jgi:hypothetical protein
MMTGNIQEFSTGAVRSTDANDFRYDLISWIGLRRVAETCKEGSLKYSDWNWLKGFPCSDVLNHVMTHIEKWRSGDNSEDHLGHAAWGLFVLMHFEETRPDLMDIPSRLEDGKVKQYKKPEFLSQSEPNISETDEIPNEYDEELLDWQDEREEFDWEKLQEEHDELKYGVANDPPPILYTPLFDPLDLIDLFQGFDLKQFHDQLHGEMEEFKRSVELCGCIDVPGENEVRY